MKLMGKDRWVKVGSTYAFGTMEHVYSLVGVMRFAKSLDDVAFGRGLIGSL
jgi:hypothetical protein